MARLLRHMTFRARSLRRSATAAEQALCRALRNRSLGYRFRRQQPLGPYVVDFFCAEARLVIEIDGPCHIRRRRDDRRRDAWLMAGGITVLRLTNSEVLQRPEESLERIKAALLGPQGYGQSPGSTRLQTTGSGLQEQ